MPELPEVETIKRELKACLIAKVIKRVIVNNPKVVREPDLKIFSSQIKDARVISIERRGKALVFRLKANKVQRVLFFHLRMTGQLCYPGSAKASRVSFEFSDGSLLDFNDQRMLGEIRLVGDEKDIAFLRNLGPDPFSLTDKEFSSIVSKSRSAIKSLLLDQAVISGIGNIYANEALFRSGVRPERKADSLREKERSALFKQLKRVLLSAIKKGGSSIDNYVRADGTKGSFHKMHQVYDRKGESCVCCGRIIQKKNIGGRSSFFCPKCQV